MKRLTATLCLTVALLLGTTGRAFSLPECWDSPTADPEIVMEWDGCLGIFTQADGRTQQGIWKDGEFQYAQKVTPPVADFQKGLKAAKSGDYATALREWKPLAKQGSVVAQYNLGQMYRRGEGVPQNSKTALKWYRLAAKQGHALAQFNLGVGYRYGKGVPQDYKTAVKWYRLAAEQGHALAQFNLGYNYANGLGVPENHTTAVKWYRLAAEQGHPLAQGNMGSRYKLGKGVLKNLVISLKWYTLSHEGMKGKYKNYRNKSLKLLNDLKEDMTSSQIAEGQQLARKFVPNKTYPSAQKVTPPVIARKSPPPSKSAADKENERLRKRIAELEIKKQKALAQQKAREEKNGQGTFTFANGNKYVGEHRDGKRHGQGTYTYADGSIEEGIWKAGDYVRAFTNKDKIIPFLQGANERAKYARFVSEQKNREWEKEKLWNQNNLPFCKRRPYHKCYQSSSSTFRRHLRKGVKISPAVGDADIWNYAGPYKNGKFHGSGSLQVPGVFKYNGFFKNGDFDGFGTHTAWEVEWLGDPEDRREKKRKYWIYTGNFRKGLRDGTGTLTIELHKRGANLKVIYKYVGQFKDDNLHGQGIAINSDDGVSIRKVSEGLWKNNALVRKFNENDVISPLILKEREKLREQINLAKRQKAKKITEQKFEAKASKGLSKKTFKTLKNAYTAYIVVRECHNLSPINISYKQLQTAKSKIRAIENYIKNENKNVNTELVWESASKEFDKDIDPVLKIARMTGVETNKDIREMCLLANMGLNAFQIPGAKKKVRKKDF